MIRLLCGKCGSNLEVTEDKILSIELNCAVCRKEKISLDEKTGWYEYHDDISLKDGEDEVEGTDLSYVVVKQNKTRNKLRRLFEGEIVSTNHIPFDKLKEKDFQKIHFWKRKDSEYCRLKEKRYVNKKGE